MDDFKRIAFKLARNPLGVVALFIVLVYGIAGWVTTSSALNVNEYAQIAFKFCA